VSFTNDTRLERRASGRYRGDVARRWWVDRGPNGGLLAALAVAAATRELDDPDRRPCSLTLHFLVPPREGELDVSVSVERTGERVTNCRLRMHQGERTTALGLLSLARPIDASDAYVQARVPDVPSPGELAPLPLDAPGVPPFLRNYEFRFAAGGLPFTGAEAAETAVWVRTASRRRPDAIAVAAFADAWARTPLVRRRAPAPVPAIDLTVHFRDHDWYGRAADDDFVLAAFRSRLLAHALFEEDGELWSPDGTLLAQSRQLGMLLE